MKMRRFLVLFMAVCSICGIGAMAPFLAKAGEAPQEIGLKQIMDIEGLDKELEMAAAEGKIVAEEVERYRKETIRPRIMGSSDYPADWGIFTVGIVTAGKQGGEREDSSAKVKMP